MLQGKNDHTHDYMRMGLDVEVGRFLGSTGDWQIGYAAGRHADLAAHRIAGIPGFSPNFLSIGLDMGFEGRAQLRRKY